MAAWNFWNTLKTFKTTIEVPEPTADSVLTLPSGSQRLAGVNDVIADRSLLAEYTVTGAAVTSIDFSWLDINTHKSYRIEMELIAGTASGGNLSCYINGNVTATNYYTQYTTFTTTTVSTTISNNAIFTTIPAVLGGLVQSNGLVTRTGDARFDSTHSNINDYRALINTGFVATQLTFIASVAGNIGIGSTIRIYRGDV